MKDNIIIKLVEPEGIGDDLKGCYYKPKNDGTFDFYDKDGKVKARNLTPGKSFSFDLDGVPGIEWTLTINTITELEVTGNWTDVPQGGEVGEPEGTYQGQAGGGFDAENAASASGY